MRHNLNFLDLFAGAGGLSEGFIQAGFTPIAHVEADEAACFTLRTRAAFHWLKENNKLDTYKLYLQGKIDRDVLYSAVPPHIIESVINIPIGKETLDVIFQRIDSSLANKKLDLIIGGPPCQAYSLVGRSRDENGMQGDKRNYLFVYYAEFLKKYNPKYFVFENVIGLLSAKDKNNNKYLETMRDLFKSYGYETEYKILSANDYSILQNRRRIILVGRLGDTTGFYPNLEKVTNQVNVGEIFKDLPPINAGGGGIPPCEMQAYHGNWLYDSGIKNNELPVTWHISRKNSAQDLEIYKIAAKLWENHQIRLNYNDLPSYLKTHKNTTSFTDRFKVVANNLTAAHTVVAHLSKDGH
ncbi:DNA cytosine methyltransferase, partial [Chromobacterium violaceum]|uniref:DNA cytosine methyltransferase n=1 Tax=Chromobacterium violaceum TaxID=536 RepID=UPI0009D98BDA